MTEQKDKLPITETREQKKTTKAPVYVNPDNSGIHDANPYKIPLTEDELNSVPTIQSLIQQANKQKELISSRSKEASNAGKWLAWGNLVTALGNLAGWGKATPVQIDKSHTLDSFRKVDQYRDLYDRTSMAYDNAVSNAKQQYQIQHNKSAFDWEQKERDRRVKAAESINKYNADIYKNSPTETTISKDTTIEQQNADTAKQRAAAYSKYVDSQSKKSNSDSLARIEDARRKNSITTVYPNPDKGINSILYVSPDQANKIINRAKEIYDDYAKKKKDPNYEPTAIEARLSQKLDMLKASINGSLTYNSKEYTLMVDELANAFPEEFMDILKYSEVATPTGVQPSTTGDAVNIEALSNLAKTFGLNKETVTKNTPLIFKR